MRKASRITPDQANELLGKRVRQARQALGLSQGELAERLTAKLGRSVTVSTMSRLEKGDRPTTIADLYALAESLEVRVDRLLPSNEPLMEAVLPVFLGLDAAENTRIHLEKELRITLRHESELTKAMVGYWELLAWRMGEDFSHDEVASALERLYDGMLMEGVSSPAFEILEALDPPIEALNSMLSAEAIREGEKVDHETLKQKLVSLVFEYFPREA